MVSTSDEYTLRTLSPHDRLDSVHSVLSEAFGFDVLNYESSGEDLVFTPERNHVIEHRGRPVANAASHERALAIPGATVNAAHTTRVGVRQAHRRRGLLTKLMRHQLHEVRNVLREPLLVLWASEGRIYQRFGYGLACRNVSLHIDNRELHFTRPPRPADRQVRDEPLGCVVDDLGAVYDRVWPQRPGWSSRDKAWWQQLLALELTARPGFSPSRGVLFPGEGNPEGYAIWRRKHERDNPAHYNEVHVVELVAATSQAYAALWQHLFSIDLTRTVVAEFSAVDEPLWSMVDEPRALGAKAADALWVRLAQLPEALSARRYSAAMDLVFDVEDALIPENSGRWRLTAGQDGAARCVPATDVPDLTCDIADLGAAYLGGTSIASLAGAGRIREHRPGAVATAATAFSWQPAPSVIDIF